MKLSREKVVRLSHLILDFIEDDEAIDYFVEPQQLRGEILRIIEGEMRTDEAIDALVRRKIESQKRTITEGSDEWDVLYRKYYDEEVARHRRVIN